MFETFSIPDAFSVQFTMKMDIEENQRWAKILCDTTLLCNSGVLWGEVEGVKTRWHDFEDVVGYE